MIASSFAGPIDSQRLTLSPIAPSDAGDVWAALDASGEHLTKWFPELRAISSFLWAEAYTRPPPWGGYQFAVRDKATRRFYGVVTIHSVYERNQRGELSYWVRSDAARRGITTEACRALIAWGFSTLGLHRLAVSTAVENAASLALIRKLGFTHEGTARDYQRNWSTREDHELFALLATDPRP